MQSIPDFVFDPQEAANIHNRILQHAWTGAGYDPSSLPTHCPAWWEQHSPVPFDIASRLNPKLTQFLRLARSCPSTARSADVPGFHFFYFLNGLLDSSDLLNRPFRPVRFQLLGDRYVQLYDATGFIHADDEVGIVFDQTTEMAAFIPHSDDVDGICGKRWPWKPLQWLLAAYFEMIEERKLQASPETENRKWPWRTDRFHPWEYSLWTQCDVNKAVTAFTCLLDTIERRVPQPKPTDNELEIQYTTSLLDEVSAPIDSFVRSFLLSLPRRRIPFRYIAPGIRFQSMAELKAQPFATLPREEDEWVDGRRVWVEKPSPEEEMPFLLFRSDGESPSHWGRPWFPSGNFENIPAGLYMDSADKWSSRDFGNGCILQLPFCMGGNGHARCSDGSQLSVREPWERSPFSELYQAGGYTGFLDKHSVQLHKVLWNWAVRVETGDWEVNENGVAGGIDIFKEADTAEHWVKYQLPLSW